ncbi:MAG: hypothetical protein RML73_01200 [Anaerolineae bacterium]|nr:hypothetical protein [Anaerolineae bacterium]
MNTKLFLVVLAVMLSACTPARNLEFEISGAINFDLKAVSADMNSSANFVVLELYNTNPNEEQPTAGGYINIYGLQAVGVGDYEVRDAPKSENEPHVIPSMYTLQTGFSFYQNPSGTFRVTAFDGNRLSVTFDITVQDGNGAQVRLRGTLNNIPFNGGIYTGS